jgi:PAS domain S-box-containing protein
MSARPDIQPARSRPPRLRRLSGFAFPGVVICSGLVILVVGNAYRLGPIAIALVATTLMVIGGLLAFRPALRLAREQSRSSEERYRLLFGRNPLPMVAYDRKTLAVIAVNDAVVKNYGYSHEECSSMTMTDFLPPEDIPLLLSFLNAHPEGSQPEFSAKLPGFPGRHRYKDGTIIDIEVLSENEYVDGRATRIAFFLNVTERNRAAAALAAAHDQAVEASNMKSAFLANVSHEIRTPMNGVIGMNELLLKTPLTDEQRELAQQVSRSGEEMLLLINDILDISKLESGNLELDVTDFDVHTTIEQTCSAPALQATAKGLHFDLLIAEEVPRRMQGDGRRLRQVLLNLVSNAVKFTAEGVVSVSVSARPQPGGAAVIRVEVADSGVGIDPASVSRMFEPFTQADASTTRNHGGTGLGLAIARELVQLMGGTISAESEPGRGSTFFFELELAAAAAPEIVGTADSPEDSDAPSPSWSSAPLVLVAEDSPINQIVATRTLERCGCRTEVVASGREALEALCAQQYDAVLMDCQMPDMDGYQATAELRRIEHGGRRTPVIAMTAHAMDGDRQRCLDAGMDDYLSKPMRHADLIRALCRWIPDHADATSQLDGDRASSG